MLEFFGKKIWEQRSRFGKGYLVYMLVLTGLLFAGLAVLWFSMDLYERSRPQNEIKELLEEKDSAYWNRYLLDCGVGESYLNTLSLSDVSFYKKMDAYTDEAPAYGVRFGKTAMLVVTLKAGRELGFGFHQWEIDSIRLLGSGLYIYAPENARIRVRGELIGEEYLVKRNAQPLALNELEAGRDDAPSLSQYRIDSIYDNTEVSVEDAEGNELSLSYEQGKAYYYAPVTHTYVIKAPASAELTVNGVVLTEANAKIDTEPNAYFEGLESYLSFTPEITVYTVDGLVLRPTVEAEDSGGLTLSCAEEENGFVFTPETVEEITPEISRLTKDAFDAYIAYLGNKGGNWASNYDYYTRFLVPGSEAADRARKARSSLSWVKGRNTALQAMSIEGYTIYADDCFTAQINFTVATDKAEGTNGLLFVFVKYLEQWRIVRVMNTTSYLSA